MARIFRIHMAGKKKTKCKNGHRLNRKNTYLRKDGSRECKECSRARSVQQKAALA
jgi:hypothetical protein